MSFKQTSKRQKNNSGIQLSGTRDPVVWHLGSDELLEQMVPLDAANWNLTMSGKRNFEARVLLHAWNNRIVRRAEVSAWADQCLAIDESDPGDWSVLANLSMPDWPVSDEIRCALETLAAPDSRTARMALVGIVARLYEAGTLGLQQVARVLYDLKMEPFGDEYPQEFWGFWDDLDLAEEGILPQSPEEIKRRIEDMLASFRPHAEWFQPSGGN